MVKAKKLPVKYSRPFIKTFMTEFLRKEKVKKKVQLVKDSIFTE